MAIILYEFFFFFFFCGYEGSFKTFLLHQGSLAQESLRTPAVDNGIAFCCL